MILHGKSFPDKSFFFYEKVKPTECIPSVCSSVFFLRMHLIIFSRIEDFGIHDILSADPWLKIGQGHRKLLNRTDNVAAVEVEAWAN